MTVPSPLREYQGTAPLPASPNESSSPVQARTQEIQLEFVAANATEEQSASTAAWRSWFAGLRNRFRSKDTVAAKIQAEDEQADSPEQGKSGGIEGIPNVSDFNPLPAETVQPSQSSSEIFAEIGLRLRQRREMLSLTLEEVERHTHVRAVFLKALEEGTLDQLPSPVQTRGILANYAAFLDLDTDTILLRFADGLQVRHREKGPGKPSRTRAAMTVNTRLPPLRGFIASDLLFGGGMAIVLVLFAIWGINRVMTVRSTETVPATPPSISDVLIGTALPTLPQDVTLIPAQDTSVASGLDATATLQLPTLGPDVNVQVNLTAAQSTYMRVTVDGKVQFEGRADLGSAYTYQGAKQVEVLVGNAAALKVTYNSQDLGLMGNFGEVIDRVYTAQGVVTPTSTQPPTATPTLKVTATPSQTPTATPSKTPTPTKPGG